MFLTDAEIRRLTGKIQHRAQSQELDYLGIEHKRRADGSLVVLKSHVEKIMGGVTTVSKAKTEPNWNAL